MRTMLVLLARYLGVARLQPLDHVAPTVHPAPDTLGIDSDKLKCLIYVATTLKLGGLVSAVYCNGYHCGLSRLRHGEKFATAAKHQRWFRMGLNGVPREQFGRGYRNGLAGRDLRQMFTATD